MSPLNNDYARPVQTQVTALSTTGWIEDDATATWTYVSANADGNTFEMYRSGDVTETFTPGMRFRCKQGAGYLIFILHAVSAYDSGNDRTTLTFFGGTDFDLADAAITDVAYSTARFPLGFTVGEENWSVKITDTTVRSRVSPVSDTFYNLHSSHVINIPVGLWRVKFQCLVTISGGSIVAQLFVALSTSSSSASDLEFMDHIAVLGVAGVSFSASAFKELEVTTETPYYLIAKQESSSSTLLTIGPSVTDNEIPTVITAVSGYY
ncbi:MAG: hypothetical protein J0M11_03795 [Anaerolineae bacterium]|nr:hypothetical protein [Anaerolineae bacterium]